MEQKEIEKILCEHCIFYDRWEHKPCKKMAIKVKSEKPECFNFVDKKIFQMKK